MENTEDVRSNDRQRVCPDCESSDIKTAMEEDSFSYGVGVDAMQLKAMVPVHRCSSCKFAFTDGEADVIRHNAICARLGIFNPDEVAGVRKQYRMGRASFEKTTGLNGTSLARWESGAMMQSSADDALLYLLTFPENMERLKRRRAVTERWRRSECAE